MDVHIAFGINSLVILLCLAIFFFPLHLLFILWIAWLLMVASS